MNNINNETDGRCGESKKAERDEWQALRVIAAEKRAAERAAGDALPAVAAGWVAPHYLLTLRTELAGHPEGAERFKLLRHAVGDVVALQRGDFWSAWLGLEERRLKFERQKHRDKMKATAKLAEANGKKRDLNEPMTEEELKACVDKVDEIMGLK